MSNHLVTSRLKELLSRVLQEATLPADLELAVRDAMSMRPIKAMAIDANINQSTLEARLRRGWALDEALNHSVGKRS